MAEYTIFLADGGTGAMAREAFKVFMGFIFLLIGCLILYGTGRGLYDYGVERAPLSWAPGVIIVFAGGIAVFSFPAALLVTAPKHKIQ